MTEKEKDKNTIKYDNLKRISDTQKELIEKIYFDIGVILKELDNEPK